MSRSNEAAPKVEWTRRAFLTRTGFVTAGALGLSGVLAACHAGSKSKKKPVTGPPRKGGTLRMGFVSGGPLESFSPHFGLATPVAGAMQNLVYDTLVDVDASGKVIPSLASLIEPNADASEFSIELRGGVIWHDGSPLTPADVIWSLRYAQLPENYSAGLMEVLDSEKLAQDGPNRVRVPLKRPYARFVPLLSGAGVAIIKNGTTQFSKPIGTGAFRVSSFTPGQRSTYERNSSYWNMPPYLDGVQIISFNDRMAMVNALLAKQLELASVVEPVAARQLARNSDFVVRESERTLPSVFVMRTDSEPFNDPRVRQAMKLVIDRQEILDVAFGGYGKLANDVMGAGYPLYDSTLPLRQQDIEQAKSLLRQAGRSDLKVTLVTSDAVSGMKQSAILFAQQASKAGIDVKLQTVPSDSYFNQGAGYLTRTFSQDAWPTLTLESLWDQTLRTDASLNETHWSYPGWNEMLNRAEAEQDLAKARDLWREPQRIQYEEGGFIIPAGAKNVGVASTNVQNVDIPGMDWLTTPVLNHAWLSE